LRLCPWHQRWAQRKSEDAPESSEDTEFHRLVSLRPVVCRL
jgi:hypothetical protein